jgi:hypothetical protein
MVLVIQFSLTLVIIQKLMKSISFPSYEHKHWGFKVSSGTEEFVVVAELNISAKASFFQVGS